MQLLKIFGRIIHGQLAAGATYLFLEHFMGNIIPLPMILLFAAAGGVLGAMYGENILESILSTLFGIR